MPGEWKGPDQHWRPHSKGHWNNALDLARDQGWSFRSLLDHGFGEARCPAGEHTRKIDGTSRTKETKAKDFEKLVLQRCTHGTKIKPCLDEARKLLEVARELVEAAEAGLDQIGAAAEGEAKFAEADRLELLLDAIDANVGEILGQRDALLAEATASPDVPDVDEILEQAAEARGRCREARSTLNQIALVLRKGMVSEAHELDERARTVQSQLST